MTQAESQSGSAASTSHADAQSRPARPKANHAQGSSSSHAKKSSSARQSPARPSISGQEAAEPRRDRTPKQHAVVYPSADALMRPQQITGVWRMVPLLAAIAAIIIGWIALSAFNNDVINAADRQQEAIQAELKSAATISLPQPSMFVLQDDETIQANLTAAGYVLYQHALSNETTLDETAVPTTLTLEQATKIEEKGIAKSDPLEAVKLLHGGWRLDVTRSSNTSMRLRCVDFTSGSVDAAIRTAMASQGITDAQIASGGIDESGNTYKTGTTSIDGTPVTWRISAVPLSDMYKITGVPDTSVFLGIRYTY